MDHTTTSSTTPPTFHILGDSYVDYICILAKKSLPGVGEDATLVHPMTARAGGSPLNTATHLTTLLLRSTRAAVATTTTTEANHVVVDDDDSKFAITIQTCFNPHDTMGRILMDHANNFQISLVNDWPYNNNNNNNDITDNDDDDCSKDRTNTSTPHCIVMVTGSERTFLTHRGCAIGWNICQSVLPKTRCHHHHHRNNCYWHIAGYYCTPEFAQDQLLSQRLRQVRHDAPDTIISLVTQYDASKQWDGGLVDDIIPLLDIMIMNEVEATSVMEAYNKKRFTSKTSSLGNGAMGNIMEQWRKFYHQTDIIFVVTMGQRGAVVFRNAAIVAHMEPPAICATDSTGAGDAFAAGFLYGHQISNGDVESALAWGCAIGSASVSVVGASVPVDLSLIEHQRANLKRL